MIDQYENDQRVEGQSLEPLDPRSATLCKPLVTEDNGRCVGNPQHGRAHVGSVCDAVANVKAGGTSARTDDTIHGGPERALRRESSAG